MTDAHATPLCSAVTRLTAIRPNPGVFPSRRPTSEALIPGSSRISARTISRVSSQVRTGEADNREGLRTGRGLD